MANYTCFMNSVATTLSRRLAVLASPWLRISNHCASLSTHHHRTQVHTLISFHQTSKTKIFEIPGLMVHQCRTCALNTTLVDRQSLTSELLMPPIEYLNRLDPHSFESYSPQQILECIDELNQCFYKDARRSFPWLQHGSHQAYIQLILSEKLEELTDELRHHPNFTALYRRLEQTYTEFNGKQLPSVLLALLRLKVSPEDHLIHQLLFKMRLLIPSMDFSSLQTTSWVSKVLPRYDTITIRILAKRFSEMLLLDRKLSPEELQSVCVTQANLLKYMAYDKIEILLPLLLKHFEDPDYLNSIGLTKSCIMVIAKSKETLRLLGSTNNMHNKVKWLLEECKKMWIEQLPSMNDDDIASICNDLRLMFQYGGYDKFTRSMFEDRVLELLDNAGDQYNIALICNLFAAINRKTTLPKLTRFDEALYSALDNEIDIMVLSQIATRAPRLNMSPKTMDKLQHIAALKANHLLQYWKGSFRILGIFVERPFTNPVHQEMFSAGVLDFIKNVYNRTGMSMSVVCALYLLTRCESQGLSDTVFEKCVSGVAAMHHENIFQAFYVINSGDNNISSKAKHQLTVMKELLHSRLPQLTANIVDLTQLSTLTLKKFPQSRRGLITDPDDLVLLESHMHLFAKFSEQNVNEPILFRAINTIHHLRYFSPQILDNLVGHVIRQKDNLLKNTVFYLALLLSKFAYRPKEVDSFLPLAVASLDELWNENNLGKFIVLLNFLSHIQCFPEKQLQQVFTLDFIKAWEVNIITDSTENNEASNRQRMKDLNRFCVLECPQLNVPWFHEQYCIDRQRREGPIITEMHREVADVLRIVVGGRQYYRSCTTTPYYYFVDFECILDQKKRLVNINRIPKDIFVDSWQRVALLVLNNSNYCVNSHYLRGFFHTKNRHLELMGYKVVQISYFEWRSMGLSKFDAKCEYLRRKIFE